MMDIAALLAELKRPWRHGEHVDLQRIVLDEPLNLDGLEVRGFDLSGAVLGAGFSARGTRFRGLTRMRGAEIRGVCDLSGASFRTDFRADAVHASEVILNDCNLQGVLSVADARLGSLSLRDGLVMANMTLEGATVDGTIDLTGAEVMGGLWAVGARIGALKDAGADISGRVRLPN